MPDMHTWIQERNTDDIYAVASPNTTQTVNCIPRTQSSSLSFQSGTPSGVGERTCVLVAQPGGKGLMAAFPSSPELGEDDAVPESCFLTLKENCH